MLKHFSKFLLFTAFIFLYFLYPKPASAQVANCPTLDSIKFEPPYYTNKEMRVRVKFNWKQTENSWKYELLLDSKQNVASSTKRSSEPFIDPGSVFQIQSETEAASEKVFIFKEGIGVAGKYYVFLAHKDAAVFQGSVVPNCAGSIGEITVLRDEFAQLGKDACNITMPTNIEYEKPFTITTFTKPINGLTYSLYILKKSDADKLNYQNTNTDTAPSNTLQTFILDVKKAVNTINYSNKDNPLLQEFSKLSLGGKYSAVIQARYGAAQESIYTYCSKHDFEVTKEPTNAPTTSSGIPALGSADNPKTSQTQNESFTCENNPALCSTAAGSKCNPKNGAQVQKDDPEFDSAEGVLTALGCIPTEPTDLIQAFIKFATAAGGGVALLLMIFGAFQMITSAGNAENLKKGQEQFTSAIIGLLFIIFSVLLLKIIGVDILNIPGFS